MLHASTLSGTVEVDGLRFGWELRREPQWCTVDGFKGMLVAVAVNGGGRECLLQFPAAAGAALRARAYRHRPQVHRASLEAGIRLAIESGWEPNSRGRPRTFEIPAT